MSIPAYLPYFVFAGTAASSSPSSSDLIARSPMRLGRRAGAPPRRSASLRVVLLGWVAAGHHARRDGRLSCGAGRSPHDPIRYLPADPDREGADLAIGRVARLLDAVPQAWLVGVQLYRALGVIFLILYASGKLPGLFAWPAGVGDIAVGLLAPVVGLAYARAPRERGRPGLGLERIRHLRSCRCGQHRLHDRALGAPADRRSSPKAS